MKRCPVVFLLLPLLVATSMGWPGDAGAHGTGHRLLKDAPAVALEFHYSDQTPMRYAEVLVFSPQDREVEHQNGRTDRHGKFVFCPDAQGQWLVKVNDGMGHAEEAAVSVGQEAISVEAGKSQALPGSGAFGPMPKVLKIIIGLSLMLNVAFAAYFLKRRSNGAANPHR